MASFPYPDRSIDGVFFLAQDEIVLPSGVSTNSGTSCARRGRNKG